MRAKWFDPFHKYVAYDCNNRENTGLKKRNVLAFYNFK